MSDATIYTWLKQEKIDRGEVAGTSTDEALELAAAKRRIKQLETELAVSRKVNEVFLEGDLPQKALPGDRVSDRAGDQRPPRLPGARRLGVGLLRLEGPAGPRRGRCGGSGWPARSPTSTRPPAAPTATCG